MAQRSSRSIDPTGTARLRQQFSRFYAGVWMAVAKQAATVAGHAQGMASAAEKIAYFDRQVESVAGGELSRARYDRRFGLEAMARSAYRAGIVAADADLDGSGSASSPTGSPTSSDHAEEEPAHREWLLALLLLLGTSYDQMVSAGTLKLRRQYAEDVTGGKSQAAIERNQRNVGRGIGKSGARGLVAYATVKAFNDAVLNRYSQAGQTTVGVIEEMQFVTAGDARVCQRCRSLATADNGRGSGVYTIRQAQGLLPVHSSCRCRWTLR